VLYSKTASLSAGVDGSMSIPIDEPYLNLDLINAEDLGLEGLADEPRMDTPRFMRPRETRCVQSSPTVQDVRARHSTGDSSKKYASKSETLEGNQKFHHGKTFFQQENDSMKHHSLYTSLKTELSDKQFTVNEWHCEGTTAQRSPRSKTPIRKNVYVDQPIPTTQAQTSPQKSSDKKELRRNVFSTACQIIDSLTDNNTDKTPCQTERCLKPKENNIADGFAGCRNSETSEQMSFHPNHIAIMANKEVQTDGPYCQEKHLLHLMFHKYTRQHVPCIIAFFVVSTVFIIIFYKMIDYCKPPQTDFTVEFLGFTFILKDV